MSVKRQVAFFVSFVALAVCAAVGAAGSSVAAVSAPSYCPPTSKTLSGVYHPSRLHVLNPCQRATGTVKVVRHEEDGDLHIDVQLTPAFKKLLNYKNTSEQHGWLVVEFMARDGGHLPQPTVGDAMTIVGAWVLDAEHGWNEIHPVWRVVLHGQVYTSGPQYGGSPAGDRSKNAAEDCRDNHGNVCKGYGHGSSSEESPPPPSSGGSSPAPAGATAKCRDGTYSFSQHRRGTCSHHGGVAVWLRTVPP